jgi:hypothetical protein
MCLHIFSHGQYGNCLIIFQPFRILDTQSLRVSANLKPHLSGHAIVKHHIVTTKRATCVGIPTAEINWRVVTIFLPLKVPVITFPQVQIPTNVTAYKTINKPQLKSFKISWLHSQPKDKTAFFCYCKRCKSKTKSGSSRWQTGVKSQGPLAMSVEDRNKRRDTFLGFHNSSNSVSNLTLSKIYNWKTVQK